MAEGNSGSSKRFVPSGVDAQSWLGFEQRIQERRFKALVETVNAALAQRNAFAARAALEEARELRPEAPELSILMARIAQLPVAIPSSSSSRYSWYRGLGAVAMFLVGIGLVIGIEALRPGQQTSSPVATVADVATTSILTPAVPSETATVPAEPDAATADTAVPVNASADSADAAAVALPVREEPLPVRPVVRPPAREEPARVEPVRAAPVARASTLEARLADTPNGATFQPPVDVEPAASASREISDDFVAPRPRNDDRAPYVDVAPSGRALAASVMPQPVSVTAPPPVLPTTSATVASAAVAPRNDDSRVVQVLNQYARAYDRLDPNAARAIWPTVDERALSRAFASLASQDVSFDACDIDVKGNLASASCRGTASYVGKVGSRQSRTEARQWNFELKLHGDDWKIEKAQASAR